MNDLEKEDGYILVVVIGILTILSLMTITFATLSRIETRATRNYTDSVKCEMVAKAGLEHAIYIIRYDKFGSNDVAYDDYNSEGDTNYDLSGDASWPGNSVFPGSDYDNNGVNGEDSKWIYFPATDSSSDIRLPGKLRARYAVLITDDREARININVTGNKAKNGTDHTSNEGWSTFEIDLANLIERQVSGKGTSTANLIIDERHGVNLYPGTSGDDDPGKIPDPQNDGIDNDGDWNLNNDDVPPTQNEIPDSGEANVNELNEYEDEANEFNSIFPYGDDIPFGLLSEVEIMGTSSYESRLEEIFNNNSISEGDQDSLNIWLTTYSADTIVCPPYGTSTATTMLNINALVNNEGAYTDSGTYNSDKKVEMIRDVLLAGGITGSSGSAGYVERHQLAVNIKDFIDSDDTVTTYIDVVPDPDETYYGIERTPYINEVEAEVKASTASGNGKFIELFNPYDTAIDLTGWKITGASMPEITLSGTINAQDYYVIADNQGAYINSSGGFYYESGADAEQYEAEVNDLTTTGEVLTLKDGSNNIVQVADYGDATGWKDRQLNDPRPTPLMSARGQSSIDPSNPWQWDNENTITAGTQNSGFDPTDGNDGWTGGTWSPSLLVANRRFSNKGYLGFTHNGRQWSSFTVDNTDVFEYITIIDPSMDNIDNDGDGSTDSSDTGSQSGDFDGPEYRIPGLINVNTASTQVLQSLPNIDSTIGDAIDTPGNKPYTSIGDLVAKVSEITDAIGTKWDEEEALRSISNLITTRSNVFTVYVTAQVTEEDVSDPPNTNVYAEKRILAIIDRSVDPIRIRYFRWITE